MGSVVLAGATSGSTTLTPVDAVTATITLPSATGTLANYAEGTWTPGVSFGGASVGVTYSSQVGLYTKIGKMVFCQMQLTLSSKGSSTGTALITGLPFTVGSPAAALFRTAYSGNFTTITDFVLRAAASGTVCDLFTPSTGGNLDNTNFQNTSQLWMAFFYTASA